MVVCLEEIKPWITNEADKAEFMRMRSPDVDETQEEMENGQQHPLTPEEKLMEQEFWKPIDDEIRADQAREAEERKQKLAKKQQQQQ